MPTRKTQALFAALAALFIASDACAQSQGVPWRTDYRAACAEAQQSGKLVLAHFWTETCGPCKQLEARVFSQPQVAMGLAAEYVPVKINATEAPELAKAFGITRVPTDAVVTPDGKLVKSFISPATPMEYVGYVSRLAAAYKSQAGAAYAVASNAAPMQQQTASATPAGSPAPDFNSAYAQLMAAGAAPPAAQQPAAPQAVAAKTNEGTNPYYAAQQQAPVTPAADITPIQPAAPAPAVVQNNSVAPVAQPSPQAVAADAPQLPPGSPPLGFEGYCPVTMKKDWRWSKGDVRFGAIHRGRTYLFSSAEAQKTFLATPDAYSPVLAGADPVAAVDSRQAVPGVREYAVEYQGRFYLFANEKSLEKFWSDPTGYATGAERVAALPAGDSFIR